MTNAIENARKMLRRYDEDNWPVESNSEAVLLDLIRAVLRSLGDEWEYGASDVKGKVTKGSEDFAYRSVQDTTLSDLVVTVRRRKAGEWEKVP